MDQFRNRKEFAAKLGIDARTLRRKLAIAKITLPKGILSPQDQQIIKKALGFNE
jgi:Bacterial regulatory protein, Fis family